MVGGIGRLRQIHAAGGQVQTSIVSQTDPPSSIEQVIFKKRQFISG
jgi:hypothetical protein